MGLSLLHHIRSLRIIRIWGSILKRKVETNTQLKRYYLRLARFLSTHGINPPLTAPAEQHEKRWREQSTAGSQDSPELYVSCNDSIERLFQEVMPLLNQDSAILEIGCNKGRSLNYLFQKGFRNLTGIEISPRAVELFAQIFPVTYKNSRVVVGNATQEIRKLKTKSFDLVFTHSVLVNIGAKHNHFFYEMCRICQGYILTLENEGSWTSFPRDFQRMFERNGFAQVSYRWLVWTTDMKSLTFPNPVTNRHVFKNNTIRLFAPIDQNG